MDLISIYGKQWTFHLWGLFHLKTIWQIWNDWDHDIEIEYYQSERGGEMINKIHGRVWLSQYYCIWMPEHIPYFYQLCRILYTDCDSSSDWSYIFRMCMPARGSYKSMISRVLGCRSDLRVRAVFLSFGDKTLLMKEIIFGYVYKKVIRLWCWNRQKIVASIRWAFAEVKFIRRPI